MRTPDEKSEDAFLASFQRDPNLPAPPWALPTDGLLEAIESVPLFMTKAPSESATAGNNTLAALQALLYEDGPAGLKNIVLFIKILGWINLRRNCW
jgi:hypothetical protein